MSQETWASVDRYLTEKIVKPDAVLDAALRESAKAGLPPISVSPPQGKLLQVLAMMQGSKRILEIGTLGGYSTIWLARGLSRGGRVITLELERSHAEIARKNLARAKLDKLVDIRVGMAIETLPKLLAEGEGPFDLVFLDADKPSNADYFAWALKLSRKGTLIVVDNVIRDGMVVDARSKDPNITGVRKLNEAIAREKRVVATTIQTVGGKGYDGFTVALVVD
ncbi:MAG: O-methyltransferase [Nitrososphaerota archaeon]|nr:O-methyltransferase [Nitrososphaerota archaeon]